MGSRTPQWGARGDSLDRRIRTNGAPGENTSDVSLDGRGRTDCAPDGGGWVDGDCGLYRRRDSSSPDRYHGHRRVQAVVRDIGPSGGWPTLTKTNYVDCDGISHVVSSSCSFDCCRTAAVAAGQHAAVF
jgi:hypothetical protein